MDCFYFFFTFGLSPLQWRHQKNPVSLENICPTQVWYIDVQKLPGKNLSLLLQNSDQDGCELGVISEAMQADK